MTWGYAATAVTAAALAGAFGGGPATALTAPKPVFDVGRAVAALQRDPIYIAPGATARLDQAAVRAALAGTGSYVVLGPPDVEYDSLEGALNKRLPTRHISASCSGACAR